MVLEYTGSPVAGKVYVYGLTLISQGNSWHYIYNAHGDVVKYINASGAVLKSYDYDAFGEEVNAHDYATGESKCWFKSSHSGHNVRRCRIQQCGSSACFSFAGPLYCIIFSCIIYEKQGILLFVKRATSENRKGAMPNVDDQQGNFRFQNLRVP